MRCLSDGQPEETHGFSGRTIHYLDTGELLPSPPIEEVREMMLRHAALLTEYKGEYTAIREMRKHVCWYTAGYPHSARLRERINEMGQCSSWRRSSAAEPVQSHLLKIAFRESPM